MQFRFIIHSLTDGFLHNSDRVAFTSVIKRAKSFASYQEAQVYAGKLARDNKFSTDITGVDVLGLPQL